MSLSIRLLLPKPMKEIMLVAIIIIKVMLMFILLFY